MEARRRRVIDVGPAGFHPAVVPVIGIKLMAGFEGK